MQCHEKNKKMGNNFRLKAIKKIGQNAMHDPRSGEKHYWGIWQNFEYELR